MPAMTQDMDKINKERRPDTLAAIERMTFPDGVVWDLYPNTTGQRVMRASVDGRVCCPLTAWCYAERHAWYKQQYFDKAGERLGLKTPQIFQIINAADGLPFHDPVVKAALLVKCGLGD